MVIIIGQTGCGKTTQICQYLRKARWTIPGEKMVCVTQPRRASAQTVAMRVCEEIFASNSSSSSQRCCLGGTVGVSVRFETMKSSETEILFCTDGSLLRELLEDPLLLKIFGGDGGRSAREEFEHGRVAGAVEEGDEEEERVEGNCEFGDD